MLKRFYVHNFRCLENFTLPLPGNSVLLIGKNGAGKTTVALALEILQKIARGTNRVGELVLPNDFSRGRHDVPMRFELEVELGEVSFKYSLDLEFPRGFRELRVLKERLLVGDDVVYDRSQAEVDLSSERHGRTIAFRIDWHLVALPIVQASEGEPLHRFRSWLASVLILQPLPTLIGGASDREALFPARDVGDLGNWFAGLLKLSPAQYSTIDGYLKSLMPDLSDIQNQPTGPDSASLMLMFSGEKGTQPLRVAFRDLSDGEKCLVIAALVISANKALGPILCFWDEPDSHLSLNEVGHFVLGLQKALEGSGGQFIATSHSPEAIRRFTEDNTVVLFRRSHLEHTEARLLKDVASKDVINSMITGDLFDL